MFCVTESERDREYPYKMATHGKTRAEAAAWWRAQAMRSHGDPEGVPAGFMCLGAGDIKDRELRLHAKDGGLLEVPQEYYHQGHQW